MILLLLLYLVIFATANQQKLVVYYFYDKPLFGYKPVPKEIVQQALERGLEPPKSTEPREVPLIVQPSFRVYQVYTIYLGLAEAVND